MADLEKDPVVHSSLSRALVIWSTLLVLSLVWALADEVYFMRPWKRYQAKFAQLYAAYLKKERPAGAEVEARIKASSEYQKLDRDMKAAEAKVLARIKEIDDEVNNTIVPQTLALNEKFQESRAEIVALTYKIETTSGDSGKDSIRADIEKIKQRNVAVKLPQAGGSEKKEEYQYAQMEKLLNEWKAEKARILQQRVVSICVRA